MAAFTCCSAFWGNNEAQLAVVKTPHIGGVLQFYKWNGKKLEITNELAGFSTHQIGSDNLNMAIASNFDDNAKDIELIIPSTDFWKLKIVKCSEQQCKITKEIKLPGKLNTNIFLGGDDQESLWLGTNNAYFVRIVGN